MNHVVTHIFPLRRALVLSGAAFIIALLVVLTGTQQARAATVTPRVELSGNAGQTVRDVLKVTNEERQSRTFYTDIQNFESQDESGAPRFSQRREDLATWISVPASITVGPGQTAELPLVVTIPYSAEPGGHFAAVFLQTSPPENSGGEVSLSAKLGTLVLLRVNGEFVQDATVLEFAAKDKRSIFTALPIYFYYRFQNVGDDHLKPVGDVLITNMFGRLTKVLPANPVDGTVLPKSVRRFETVWASSFGKLEQGANPEIPKPAGPGFWNAVKYQWHNFALGKYTATLKVVYGTKELKSEKVKYTFWVIPWQLLMVVIGGVLVLGIVGRFGVRRYNRYIIRQARGSVPQTRQSRSKK